MFIAHFATALGAKRIDRSPSLGTLFIAALLPDLLMPFFLILGLEKIFIQPDDTAFTPVNLAFYPYSHSLSSAIVLALIVGFIYYFIKKNKNGAFLLAGLVLTHFLLDLISHRPDLQLLWWNEFRVGLGLWNSVGLTLIIEISLFLLGSFFYLRATQSKNRVGTISLAILLLFLGILYLMSAFGPPPPGEKEFAYAGLLTWLFVAWGYWIDNNRIPTE